MKTTIISLCLFLYTSVSIAQDNWQKLSDEQGSLVVKAISDSMRKTQINNSVNCIFRTSENNGELKLNKNTSFRVDFLGNTVEVYENVSSAQPLMKLVLIQTDGDDMRDNYGEVLVTTDNSYKTVISFEGFHEVSHYIMKDVNKGNIKNPDYRRERVKYQSKYETFNCSL